VEKETKIVLHLGWVFTWVHAIKPLHFLYVLECHECVFDASKVVTSDYPNFVFHL